MITEQLTKIISKQLEQSKDSFKKVEEVAEAVATSTRNWLKTDMIIQEMLRVVLGTNLETTNEELERRLRELRAAVLDSHEHKIVLLDFLDKFLPKK